METDENKNEKKIIKMSLSPHTARQFIDIIGAIVDEFRLSISKEGWKVKAGDPANVVLVNIDLPEDSFLEYEFEESGIWTSSIDGHPTGIMEDVLEVGIDVNTINDFLGGIDDTITEVILDEERYAPVRFSFNKAPERYSGRYVLTLKQGMFSRELLLLNPEEIRRPPKNIVFISDYMLLLDSFQLERIIEKAIKVNDYIRMGFRYKKDSMVFIASTEDNDDFPWKAEEEVSLWQSMVDKPREISSSLFSLDYWYDIVKELKKEKVWLYLGRNSPCKLSFTLGLTGRCEYLLAPRIELE